MLLYLLLLLPLVRADPLADCDIDYKCYMPMNCKENQALVDVSHDGTLNSNCFVFLKLHPFSSQKTQLVMESFDDSTYSIELLTSDNTVILTCTTENGITKAFQGRAGDKSIKLINQGTESENLRCEFDFDFSGHRLLLSSPGKIFLDGIILKTQGQQEYKTKESIIKVEVFCSPDVLITSQDYKSFERDKFYAKAEYRAGHVVCPQPNIFTTIEYRIDDENENKKYEQIQEMNCENKKFLTGLQDGSKKISPDDDIDIRCVADAEYFCDYDPKHAKINNATQQILSRQKPNLTATPPQKGKIYCNTTHPFLVINGRILNETNVEIKCQNHFGKMKWTFNKTILSDTGPEVHCIANLECHVMSKMTRANLEKSFLDVNHLPTCHDGGKLSVREGNAATSFVVNKTICNVKTGQYYYITDGQSTHLVTHNTRFFCTYEEVPNDPNKLSNSLMTGGAVALFLLILGIGLAVGYYIYNKEKKKLDKVKKWLELADVDNSERIMKNRIKGVANKGNKQQKPQEEKINLLENDYLLRKRRDAEKDVLYEVLHKQIPANRNREKANLSKQFIEKGLRYSEIREFTQYDPNTMESDVMAAMKVNMRNELGVKPVNSDAAPVEQASKKQSGDVKSASDNSK